MSHLRNSIAIALTVLVFAVAAFGPVCAPVCAQATRHACCQDGAPDCGPHAVSADALCGHVVVAVAERVEQPIVAAGLGLAMSWKAPVWDRIAVTVRVEPARVGDLPPPRWFDPLVVSLRV